MDPIREGFVSQDLVVWGEFLFDPETLYFPFDTQVGSLVFLMGYKYCCEDTTRTGTIFEVLKINKTFETLMMNITI